MDNLVALLAVIGILAIMVVPIRLSLALMFGGVGYLMYTLFTGLPTLPEFAGFIFLIATMVMRLLIELETPQTRPPARTGRAGGRAQKGTAASTSRDSGMEQLRKNARLLRTMINRAHDDEYLRNAAAHVRGDHSGPNWVDDKIVPEWLSDQQRAVNNEERPDAENAPEPDPAQLENVPENALWPPESAFEEDRDRHH
ncbi:hypothetical protein [Halomontanus rarus]|uniref:hypothetical protein n=1 Tax=Halomontanus rarus TaxID=3034020 RepID=UPI001A981B66